MFWGGGLVECNDDDVDADDDADDDGVGDGDEDGGAKNFAAYHKLNKCTETLAARETPCFSLGSSEPSS